MNSFIKQVLATVVGIMLFFLITGVIATMSLVGMIASSEATKNVKENSVLVINLSGVMKERSQDNVLNKLTRNATGNPGLENTLAAIKKAKETKMSKAFIWKQACSAPTLPRFRNFDRLCPISANAASGLLLMAKPIHKVHIIWHRLPTKYISIPKAVWTGMASLQSLCLSKTCLPSLASRCRW